MRAAADLGLNVYFCDPHSPWQRGSNENTNRLLRQYLAKGVDLRQFSLRDLDDIAARTNTRPAACSTGPAPPSCSSRACEPSTCRKGIRMRTREGMAVAKAKGRLKGKQPTLSPSQRKHLLELAAAGQHTQAELAELLRVSRTTVYRELQRAAR